MTTQTKSRGFTIVELLIVIVIIAILAAITIVAYNGITNRANTASAKAAANNAIKKIEAYASETGTNGGGDGSYPNRAKLLTDTTSDKIYQLTGVSFTTTVGTNGTAPSSPSTLNYYSCTAGGAISYYDYGTKTWIQLFTSGATSGTCTYKSGTATS